MRQWKLLRFLARMPARPVGLPRTGVAAPQAAGCWYARALGSLCAPSRKWCEEAQQGCWRRRLVVGSIGGALVFGGFSSYVVLCKERVHLEQLAHSGVYGEERFEVKSKLGEGGQAEVFKALDKKTRRMVAIKVTRKSLSGGKDLVLPIPALTQHHPSSHKHAHFPPLRTTA